MRILHTSDWHLGVSLHGKRRFEESSRFLSWLICTIQQKDIDVLLVTGDIFDSSAPSSRSQRMYYEFLGSASRAGCSSVIIIAGNHDSPSLLSAPRELLHPLRIYVSGSIDEDLSRHVIPVTDLNGTCRLIVCAVPFLREKDIRLAVPAGSGISPCSLLTEGIAGHYRAVSDIALEMRSSLSPEIPIVATGHLFAAGCETRTGEGVRECYVGNSVLIGADAFPSCLSYVALGHLHVPQCVAGRDFIRYSGSPVPVGFSEAEQEKKVIIIDVPDSQTVMIEECPVPRFQKLASLKGKKQEIEEQISCLIREGDETWIEVIVDSSDSSSSLQNWIAGLTRNTILEPLRMINTNPVHSSLYQRFDGESLDQVSEKDVFSRRIGEEDLSDEEKDDLTMAFEEILLSYHQTDRMEYEK